MLMPRRRERSVVESALVACRGPFMAIAVFSGAINILTPGEQSLQTIPASRELTFQFMQASASSPSYCLRNVRFTPKAGGNYEFTASENIGQCVWSMVEQVEGKPQSVPFVDVGWKAGWDENGSFCKK